MSLIGHVDLNPLPPERFETVLGAAYAEFADAMEEARALFAGRVIWNVNSTGKGGGVAEMLRSLIAYAQGMGVDARWVVITGNPGFFQVTKRIHNHLHGAPGDGGELGEAERKVYEDTLGSNAGELVELVSANDIVILHDPQTAGLCSRLKDKGATVLWRCHVGLDTLNDLARGAWRFLAPFLTEADSYVFSRQAFVWHDLPDDKIEIIPPSIDAFSPKNQDMSPDEVRAILTTAGLLQGSPDDGVPRYLRVDGSEGRVTRRAEMDGGALPDDAPWVVQVSRWDRLKDPMGVMVGFADRVPAETDARLLLAGPAVKDVADDPEGAEALAEVQRARDGLPVSTQERIHLACLPMEDGDENAAIVNAVQRQADVVVQKSLAEGFGLTVAEGMWKSRPVVASRIGGIQDQIEDGVSGVLLDDPRDVGRFGDILVKLLNDPERAEAIGVAARERVRNNFLGARHLIQYLRLMARLIA